MRPSFTTVSFKDQNYCSLKKYHIANKTLFCDPEFPPNNTSLIRPGSSVPEGIQWKRPHELCKYPSLILDEVSEHDLVQGNLGNCWFVAACSSLVACRKHVWINLIPNHEEQEWDSRYPDCYAGVFHFLFWHYGDWLDVVIDDLLPTKNNQLVYLHSEDPSVFWSALFEKAYAKLVGCYEALDGGELAEAIEDFTSGISESISLPEYGDLDQAGMREDLFASMLVAIDRNALMCASIPALSSSEVEKMQASGLMMGHAYSITAVKRVHVKDSEMNKRNLKSSGMLNLLRLRNPWDQKTWKGRFSVGSQDWSLIVDKDITSLQLNSQDEGEFWMLFDDFCLHFRNLVICRVVNTHIFSGDRIWHESLFHSEWEKPDLCGGCLNNHDTFWCNPQKYEHNAETDELSIGFTIIKVEQNRTCKVRQVEDVIASSAFKKGRSVFLRQNLNKGRYLLIPSTFKPDQTGSFLLRIYTALSHWARELFHHIPQKSDIPAICCCIKPKPVVATQVRLIKATNLQLPEGAKGSINPYCIIRCQNESVYSSVCEDICDPEWNMSAIFYRKKPHTVIIFEVWSLGVACDELIGKHKLSQEEETTGHTVTLDLVNKHNNESSRLSGQIIVRIINSFDLAYI